MAHPDPDNPSQAVIDELLARYEEAAAKLRRIVAVPPGRTDTAIAFHRADAASRLAQVDAAITNLKRGIAPWTSRALTGAVRQGAVTADQQLAAAGIVNPVPTFSLLNERLLGKLARDTVGDLYLAAESMGRQAETALRHMAATGVTNGEVNEILAGAWSIEGKPALAVRQLKDALEKVHGEKITIQGKNGPITYDVDYYADLVAHSKMKQASVDARHETFQQAGIDLIQIAAQFMSVYPCTALVGRVFSLSGRSDKHPAYSTVSAGQEPYRLFHPHCHKYTVSFIEKRASRAQLAGASGELRGDELHRARVEEIRAGARAHGYEPPPHGQAQ